MWRTGPQSESLKTESNFCYDLTQLPQCEGGRTFHFIRKKKLNPWEVIVTDPKGWAKKKEKKKDFLHLWKTQMLLHTLFKPLFVSFSRDEYKNAIVSLSWFLLFLKEQTLNVPAPGLKSAHGCNLPKSKRLAAAVLAFSWRHSVRRRKLPGPNMPPPHVRWRPTK